VNKLFTLSPAFADVSINMIFICVDFAVASSIVTWLVDVSGDLALVDENRRCDKPFF
jgi:hypothetical protein